MVETAKNMNMTAREVGVVLPGSWTMENRTTTRTDPVAHWLLEFIVSGSLQVRTPESPWVTLEEGHGVLYPPGVFHDERVPKGECSSVGVYFDVHSDALAQRLTGGQGSRLLVDAEGRAIRQIVQLRYIHDIGDIDGYGGHGCLCLLVWMLLASPRKDGWTTIRQWPSVLPEPVLKANLFMRGHLHVKLRIQDICAHVGLSASGLHHAYRRATGKSPMAGLRAMRVEAARVLLLRSDMTLDQVAARTGFADAFHLSRVFKKVTGKSPRAFRCAARGGS